MGIGNSHTMFLTTEDTAASAPHRLASYTERNVGKSKTENAGVRRTLYTATRSCTSIVRSLLQYGLTGGTKGPSAGCAWLDGWAQVTQIAHGACATVDASRAG